MAIIKNKNLNSSEVVAENVPIINVDLEDEENLETFKFNKEEYIKLLDEAKEQGHALGYEDGIKEGYEQGLHSLKEETTAIKNKLEEDIENAKSLLQYESVKYIDAFKGDIYSLIKNTINKIFFNSISDTDIMNVYLKNLSEHIIKKYSNVKIFANEKTLNLMKCNIDSEDVTFSLNKNMEDYDVKILSESENVEFYLKDEIDKIKELFV